MNLHILALARVLRKAESADEVQIGEALLSSRHQKLVDGLCWVGLVLLYVEGRGMDEQ